MKMTISSPPLNDNETKPVPIGASAKPAARATPDVSHWLALGAVAGPIIFTLGWIVLGVLQPVTKNMYGVMGGISGAISNPISGLGVGPQAQLFNAIFVLCGLLLLAGVVGVIQTTRTARRPLARWVCTVLLALSPLGLAMAGIYSLASSILLHTVGALLLFDTPVVSFLVAGFFFRGIPKWRRFGGWLLLGSPLTLILFILYSATFNQAAVAAGQGIAGLTERILQVEVHAWFVAMGWLAFRRS
jgi:hypothetical membrane protein